MFTSLEQHVPNLIRKRKHEYFGLGDHAERKNIALSIFNDTNVQKKNPQLFDVYIYN
jgi:hypothetical protein